MNHKSEQATNNCQNDQEDLENAPVEPLKMENVEIKYGIEWLRSKVRAKDGIGEWKNICNYKYREKRKWKYKIVVECTCFQTLQKKENRMKESQYLKTCWLRNFRAGKHLNLKIQGLCKVSHVG